MEDIAIIEAIQRACKTLQEKDFHLLLNNLSERSITHWLAIHLMPFFPGFNIDCEYNGDVDRDGHKRVDILRDRLLKRGLLTDREMTGPETETIERQVYPDIIVHRRGDNDHNLCIIEVKKSKSTVPIDYDRMKLEAYTTTYYGNNLFYQLGVFIILRTDKGYIEPPALECYKEGVRVPIPTM